MRPRQASSIALGSGLRRACGARGPGKLAGTEWDGSSASFVVAWSRNDWPADRLAGAAAGAPGAGFSASLEGTASSATTTITVTETFTCRAIVEGASGRANDP